MTETDPFIPITPNVANEFGKNPRTIKRWIADPKLKFPTPIRINQRLFVTRSALDAWKRRQMEAGINERSQA